MTKHPLMYRGYFIKRCFNGNLSAYSWRTDYFINPLYRTWDQLKSILDNLKDES
jgi:hypothetical protein